MPSLVQPLECLRDYLGLPELMEFTNDDGELCRTNCGQAAVATLLHFVEGDIVEAASASLMSWLETEHPPDNLGGWLGTSRRRVERGLRSRGHRPFAIEGVDRLRAMLARGRPVIVVVQMKAGRIWRFDLPGAHWMVAFGFDREHIYLTNRERNRMKWEEFVAGWSGWVPALTGMRGKGLIVDWRDGTPASKRGT